MNGCYCVEMQREAVALATLIATLLTIIALNSSAEGARERDSPQSNFVRAERIRLAAQAQIPLDSGEDVRIPALLALRSLELGYSPEADAALRRDFSRQTYVGHTGDGITHAYFSPDGSRVLTTGTDATARLWDTLSGEELQRFSGHDGIVDAGAFTPDGAFVLASGNDGTIRQRDVTTRKPVREFSIEVGDFVNNAPVSNCLGLVLLLNRRLWRGLKHIKPLQHDRNGSF